MNSEGVFRFGRRVLLAVALFGFSASLFAAAPVVSNVRASQRAGSKLVDIYYDLADPDSPNLTVTVAVSTNGGVSYTLPASSFTGAVGAGVTPGNNKQIVWNAGADWNGKFSANVRFRVTADDSPAPPGMVLIPTGSFTMGDTLGDWPAEWGANSEIPAHSVCVSAFYTDRYEVTKALWDDVKAWDRGNGYEYDVDSGYGKAADHPVSRVSWYDVVKWCNARSEKEGLTPCYYTDAGLTVIYKTGQVTPYAKWDASGYRLPTEAEWEKAARGGVNGRRFPWSDSDFISHGRANYYAGSTWTGDPSYSYDLSYLVGHHSTFNDGMLPYTSPVGYFSHNGYGLHDMAGNVREWCWDWYDSNWYSNEGATESDTRGPSSGDYRVLRGGGWDYGTFYCRVAHRVYLTAMNKSARIGFRSVRVADQ